MSATQNIIYHLSTYSIKILRHIVGGFSADQLREHTRYHVSGIAAALSRDYSAPNT